ncbi:ferrochelatase [Bifidobacterium actinocoloniiforme DSM 22766]|uniref:Coproporphyrin III ferrochelatase n=2 Tax=Bifidobacterium actinocoloniiforme TaxID=638619 RepID=A0A086Z092_9BIFI|nr:ferrochelatase [Bifidobacterium actinocoloniiforme]AKV55196.1 ferrochelatase [Bifidobacterium actinocoloniiforme DSM 22766]KFI39942.1 ferrochelatase [Bifidobacterium actinocoloniiforme DSM 22766]
MNKQAMTAVLLMAYGTPSEQADIEPYYRNIRHNHANPNPPKALLDELTRRYLAIGLPSPLARITQAQGDGLQALLDEEAPGKYRVYVGLRYIEPFIAQTVERIVADGAERIIGLPLAPEYSSFSSEGYHNIVRAALKEHPDIDYAPVKSWWRQGELIDFWSQQLEDLKALTDRPDTRLLFSAHSLLRRIIERGDPYGREVTDFAKAIAAQAGLRQDQWTLAWQSAGRTKEPWMGPAFESVARELVAEDGVKTVISASIGFVAENLEIRYDIDITLKKIIQDEGGRLIRLSMPNDDIKLLKTLRSTVLDLEEPQG